MFQGAALGDNFEPANTAQGIGKFIGQAGMSLMPWVGQAASVMGLTEAWQQGWDFTPGASIAMAGGAFTFGVGDAAKAGVRPLLGKAAASQINQVSVNAGTALRSKLSALQGAQKDAANIRFLPDGRIRYYDPETPARTPGPTRGASYVTEWDPSTSGVRSWMESYDQFGNVNRVHPKTKDGFSVNSAHYPPTGKELGK